MTIDQGNIFIRMIIAVVVFVLATLVSPLALSVVGISLGADALLLIKLCVAGALFFYIIGGPWRTGA